MNPNSKTSLGAFDRCIVGVMVLASIYLYVGFFFPDSYILSYGPNPSRILWVIRIGLPILCVGVIILYRNVRLRRVESGSVLLLISMTFVSMYMCYGIADAFYQRWFDRHRHEYHPFLQLMPTEYKPLPHHTSNAITVFCLGGSTTELPDNAGHDWPSRVQAILQASHGVRDVEVYNLGRQWYTSLHTLINYETNLRQYKPSVILIMQSVNDLLHNADFSYFSHGAFRTDYGHFYGPVNRIIDRRSLWHYLHDVVSGLWYATPRRILTTNEFPGLKSYIRNISTIIELARRDSTRVVLITEPFLVKKEMSPEELAAIGMLRVEAINDTIVWSSETILNGMQQYNNALKEIAQKNDLLLIDLEKDIPKSLTFFRDEVHYQDTTFSIIAPLIANRLQEFLAERGPEK